MKLTVKNYVFVNGNFNYPTFIYRSIMFGEAVRQRRAATIGVSNVRPVD